MKIGIVCYPTYGGSGAVATELGIALAGRGHEVHIISYAAPFRLAHFYDNLVFHAVEKCTYPLFEFDLYPLALAGKCIEVARDHGLEILHVHYAIPHAVSAFLAREIVGRGTLKLVTTLHGTDSTIVGREPSLSPLVTFSLRESDGVTAVSCYLEDVTRRTYDIAREIEVIPNFVDTKKFAPAPTSSFRSRIAPKGERILVHVSNFRPVKRVQDAIRAFRMIRARVQAFLLLIGDGPDRPACEKLARESGLSHDVYFLGKQDAVEEVLAASDLFLLPSEIESFGLSALEAMSCGVPVISTDCGGIPEVNIHGQTGYLVPTGDVEAMADCALALLLDREKHEVFSEAARRRAVNDFDVSRVVPHYERFYEEILMRGGSQQ
ncbi:MAG: N-acetyl-alpha-D-glucosaminyl L-malate synthase BshA [Bacteroidota bacterium]|nr:N-acetyl-alpha-D-glucosaminyl L-malate synthase BshA [Bacteroidota bacterium]